MPTKTLALSLVYVLTSGWAVAQPMSAIDWLTDSVAIPVAPQVAEDDVATTATSESISVRPIDGPSLFG